MRDSFVELTTPAFAAPRLDLPRTHNIVWSADCNGGLLYAAYLGDPRRGAQKTPAKRRRPRLGIDPTPQYEALRV